MNRTRLFPVILGAALLAAPAALAVPALTEAGYAVPQPGHVFNFPRDHGSHPDFKIEWWYLTGHLDAASGERFGYQATFFRNALRPPATQASDGTRGATAFGRDHLFLAHMALTDVTGGRFLHEERLNRDGWQASAATDRLEVRNGNWELIADETGRMDLRFTVDDRATVSLQLQPAKPLVVFGEDGTSRKGADPTARSYYLTWSRLASVGTVSIDDQVHRVTGTSWMDHEIASQQLGEELEGWDWTAIQLDDGWEIKAYVLRQDDGSASPFSALMWIDPAGRVSYRTTDAFTWARVREWTSPQTGARYPTSVDLQTLDPRTGESVTLRLRPLLEAQELSTGSAGFAYWEGACDVYLAPDAPPVGRAYLELVGYGGEAEGGLR